MKFFRNIPMSGQSLNASKLKQSAASLFLLLKARGCRLHREASRGYTKQTSAVNSAVLVFEFAICLYASVFSPNSVGLPLHVHPIVLLALLLMSYGFLAQEWAAAAFNSSARDEDGNSDADHRRNATNNNDTDNTDSVIVSGAMGSWSLVPHLHSPSSGGGTTAAPVAVGENKQNDSASTTNVSPDSDDASQEEKWRNCFLTWISFTGLIFASVLCVLQSCRFLIYCYTASVLNLQAKRRGDAFLRVAVAYEMLTFPDEDARTTWDYWKQAVESDVFNVAQPGILFLALCSWALLAHRLFEAFSLQMKKDDADRRSLYNVFEAVVLKNPNHRKLILFMLIMSVSLTIAWWCCCRLRAYVIDANPYAVLGVTDNADRKEIKRAFRTLSWPFRSD